MSDAGLGIKAARRSGSKSGQEWKGKENESEMNQPIRDNEVTTRPLGIVNFLRDSINAPLLRHPS